MFVDSFSALRPATVVLATLGGKQADVHGDASAVSQDNQPRDSYEAVVLAPSRRHRTATL
jgi:hypothetical protein